MKFAFFSKDFLKNSQTSNFINNPPSVSGVVAAGETDRRTDVRKLIVKLGKVQPCTGTEALVQAVRPITRAQV